MWKHLEETGDKGFISVVDCEGMSLSNLNLGMMSFMNELTSSNPNASHLDLIVNLPHDLTSVMKGILWMLPEETKKGIQFIDRSQLTDFIPKENIPDFLGGTCNRPYCGREVVPKGCLSMREVMNLVLNENSSLRENEFVDANSNIIISESPVLWPQGMTENQWRSVIEYHERMFSG